MVPSELGQSRSPGWGAMNPQNAMGRRGGARRASGVRAGQGGGWGYLETYYFSFHSAACIFPSFNLFCSSSQVKNFFHEPGPAAAALRPAMDTGGWPGTVALHPSSNPTAGPALGGQRQGRGSLGTSLAVLWPCSPILTLFSCGSVLFGMMAKLDVLCVL